MKHRMLIVVALMTLGAAGLSQAEEGAAPADAASPWERRLASLDREDATAAFKLALELEAAGAADLATKAYEIVVGIDPDHRAGRRALGYERLNDQWLRGKDLLRAKGFVHHGDTWMTSEQFADATRPQRDAAEQRAGENRVLALLAKIGTEDPETVRRATRRFLVAPDKFKLAPLAKALRCDPVSLRLFAAGELGRLGDPLAVPALLKAATHDKDTSVRTAAAKALKQIDSPDTVHPLGRALNSRYANVRAAAADALATLGDEAGLGYVVNRWVGRAGDFPRVYFAQVNQLSYIQDFDVEVAQTSFIADPVVGVLQEGLSHAVKIHATEYTFTTVERPAYAKAMKALSGMDYGTDLSRWRKFWIDNRERILNDRAERYRRRSRSTSHPTD